MEKGGNSAAFLHGRMRIDGPYLARKIQYFLVIFMLIRALFRSS
ncbi:Hypothetical protein OINT_2001181 [Brucella intermedia LMG 3301]|uniref:Uncharacterized protein n=1 Tax=Brucella intermedia LMG 3301 TaxID=641118 RepID=C4WNQ5_9HYPH|nr:Hypothetical protein OINT_2001181 [Brucella intermedia LMG 3301]